MQNTVDSFFTAIARAEELLYPGSVLLRDFPRSIQTNRYECGLRCVWVIVQHCGKRCTIESIRAQLDTDKDGTTVTSIKHVLRKHDLAVRELNNARPLIISYITTPRDQMSVL